MEYFDRDYKAALHVLAADRMPVHQNEYYTKPMFEGWTHLVGGDTSLATVAFDSARIILEGQVQKDPDDPRVRSALGLAYAGLGRKPEAVREGQRAIELMPMSRDAIDGSWYLLDMVFTCSIAGEQELAIDYLERYVSGPGAWSLQGLARDPRMDPLRDHPRFQALLARYEQPRERLSLAVWFATSRQTSHIADTTYRRWAEVVAR